jgi:2-polyprenyl-6-methoxyphenol hydroxylase-like FAD-dependent oxidoreductase
MNESTAYAALMSADRAPGETTVVKVPVLVVGAGPTGLTTSILLSRWGIPSLTVERHPGTTIFPRAIAVNTRSMEIFRSLGLDERIRQAGFRALPFVARSRTLIDPEPELSPSLGTPPTDVSPAAWTTCSQLALEPILLDEAISHPIAAVRFGVELHSLRQSVEGVCAQLVERESGRAIEVRCRFVVAADGARSTVRRLLRVGMAGFGELGHNVNIHFLAPLMQRLTHPPIFLHGVHNERASGVIYATDGRSRWVLATGYRPKDGESPADFTVERCVQLVRDASGVPDLEVEVLGVSPWTTVADVAARWRSGSVFLAGDAAHRMTPAGGIGMNTGIQDGHNLAWKLAAVMQQWAGPALLDTYETERRPVAQSNVRRTVELLAAGSPLDGLIEVQLADVPPASTPLRTALDVDLGFAYQTGALVAEPVSLAPSDTGDYIPSAAPGHRLPHLWLREGASSFSTMDCMTSAFTVFAGRRSSWKRAVAQVATASRVPLRTQHLPAAGGDTWTSLLGITDSGCVLMRPDGHVAWRSHSGAANPVAELRSALAMVLARDDAPGAARRNHEEYGAATPTQAPAPAVPDHRSANALGGGFGTACGRP